MLPTDIFRIITDYAFNIRISQNELFEDIIRVQTIKECIDDEFLCICAWDTKIKKHVCNPYRSFAPYRNTRTIDHSTIMGNTMLCLCHCLSKHFFDRLKSYRLVFMRYAKLLERGELSYFNRILSKYLIYIEKADISHLDERELNNLMLSLDRSSMVPIRYL